MAQVEKSMFREYDIRGRVNDTELNGNTAEVTGADQPDADDTFGDGAGNDHDTASTTPTAVVDLSLSKTVDDASPLVGDSVTFTATDDGTPALSDAETILITVNEVNDAPVLDPIGNQTVNELALLTFTATATGGNGSGSEQVGEECLLGVEAILGLVVGHAASVDRCRAEPP